MGPSRFCVPGLVTANLTVTTSTDSRMIIFGTDQRLINRTIDMKSLELIRQRDTTIVGIVVAVVTIERTPFITLYQLAWLW